MHSLTRLTKTHFRFSFVAALLTLMLPIAVLCQETDDPMSIRVKDLADIEGVRSNQLIGYGLVIGLNRTGDKVQQNQFSRQTVQNLLERMGISTNADTLKPENVATVMVTASLPPFIRQGSKLDVTVSSIADARSLQGGTLVLTELKAVNGLVYAVAQGSVCIGGISAGRAGNSVEINHPTVGRVPNGATVERTVNATLAPGNKLTLVLRNDDFSTAAKLHTRINKHFGGGIATALDARNIEVKVPASFGTNKVAFIAELESLKVTPDKIAKIVINERTGTIIMGREVRIGAVAISQGGVTVRIGTQYDVVQPGDFSTRGRTTVVPDTTVDVEQKAAESVILPEGATVDEVVRGLRAMGVSARDTISILQAIKSAGAMNADLEMQ
ncbi:MAG: flagellar basal body P-ring protein FlgI [Pyrinomonadaceae bacterium]|nr:flagellar basal body P-ring protein FlgI [Pyrinomonadaceae bacterium]